MLQTCRGHQTMAARSKGETVDKGQSIVACLNSTLITIYRAQEQAALAVSVAAH